MVVFKLGGWRGEGPPTLSSTFLFKKLVEEKKIQFLKIYVNGLIFGGRSPTQSFPHFF
jgi:hypothetical protein